MTDPISISGLMRYGPERPLEAPDLGERVDPDTDALLDHLARQTPAYHADFALHVMGAFLEADHADATTAEHVLREVRAWHERLLNVYLD